MIIELKDAKEFLRVDYDSEDSFITLLINGSEGFLKGCIDDYNEKVKNDFFKEKAQLCCYVLIQNMFDDRSLTTKDEEKLKYSIQSLLLQLQYCTI